MGFRERWNEENNKKLWEHPEMASCMWTNYFQWWFTHTHPQAIYSCLPFISPFLLIHLHQCTGGEWFKMPWPTLGQTHCSCSFLEVLCPLFRSFNFAFEIIWSSLLLDYFSWQGGRRNLLRLLWLLNWLLLKEHYRLVKRRWKLGNCSPPSETQAAFLSQNIPKDFSFGSVF